MPATNRSKAHRGREACSRNRGSISGATALALLLGGVVAGQLALPELSGAADWPQFRGPDRDGVSTESGLIRSFPEGGPRILWRAGLGEGFSGISKVEDRLFTLFSDGSSEFAISLEASGGKEIWRHRLDSSYSNGQGNGPRSTPTVHAGVAYALGAQGRLAALEAESGRVIWEVDLKARVGARPPKWGVSTSPLVEGDLLILDAGGKDGASVVALDRRTGETVWTSADDIAGYSSPLAISAAGARQVLVFTGRKIVGVAPADGTVLWERDWKTDWDVNAAMPIPVPPNKVFVASGYNTGAAMLRLDPTAEGIVVRTLWESRGMKNQFSSSVLHEGHIYGFDNSILKCLRAADGEECWKARGFEHGSLLYADGMLIVLGERGKVALVEASPEGYSELASAQVLEGKCWTPPTLAEGVLYLRNEEEVVALDLNP